MTDTQKLNVIRDMISDFWDCNDDANRKGGALAFIVAISSVMEHKEDSNA